MITQVVAFMVAAGAAVQQAAVGCKVCVPILTSMAGAAIKFTWNYFFTKKNNE